MKAHFMFRKFLAGLAVIPAGLLMAPQARAQSCCAPAPVITYRVVQPEITYETRTATAYRLEYETVFREEPITVMRDEVVTENRQRRYRVAKPVLETAEHEEAYTVMRPVCVNEERDQVYTTMRPVYETSEREEQYTTYRPVTTYRTEYVDQGGFVEQPVVTPPSATTRLRFNGGWATNPATGVTSWSLPFIRPTVVQTPAVVQTYRYYQPNVVAAQVPQTTMMPVVETRKVCVPTVRYEQVQEVRKVSVQVQKMVPQQMTRKVPAVYRTEFEERVEDYPVQVCRKVAVQETRRVPMVVTKRVPVTYTYRVPVCAPTSCCATSSFSSEMSVMDQGAVQTDFVAPAPSAGSGEPIRSQEVGPPTGQPNLRGRVEVPNEPTPAPPKEEVRKEEVKKEEVKKEEPKDPPAPPASPAAPEKSTSKSGLEERTAGQLAPARPLVSISFPGRDADRLSSKK